MKNHYIELIEKIASESTENKSILRPRKVVVDNTKRTNKENKFIKDNNLDTYQQGSEINFAPLINLDNLLSKEDISTFAVKGRGKLENGNDMEIMSFMKDVARQAAREKNREAEYDKTLDSLKKPIETRRALASGAKGALTLGGALAGAMATKGTKAGVLPGAIGGLIAGGMAGNAANRKLHAMNSKHYFNSLDDYQRERLDNAISDLATRTANNPYGGKTYMLK